MKLIAESRRLNLQVSLLTMVLLFLGCNPMYFVAEPGKDDGSKSLHKENDTYIVQKKDLLFEMLVVGDSDTKFYCLVANLSENEYKLVPENVILTSRKDSFAITEFLSEDTFWDEKWGADYIDEKPYRLNEIIIPPSDVKIFGFQFSIAAVDSPGTFTMDQFQVIVNLMNIEEKELEEMKFNFRKRSE